MTNPNDPELLAMAEKIINSPEHIERVAGPRKSLEPPPEGVLKQLLSGPPGGELNDEGRWWRAQYWRLRRMLEHIAETEGEDAAARMRSIAKDALCGKAYAERG